MKYLFKLFVAVLPLIFISQAASAQKSFQWEDHSYKMKGNDQDLTVTFSNFPASEEEFAALQEKLLGKSRPGALVLCLMAMEMYRRDRAVGEKCVRLCNTSVNASSVLRGIKEKFPANRGPVTDSYHQPYLVAACLAGATQANKYQPKEPYQLRIKLSTNPYDKQGEYSSFAFGHIYHYVVTRNGDQEKRCSVIVPDEGEYVLVNNCPNLYYALPPIQKWEDTLK